MSQGRDHYLRVRDVDKPTAEMNRGAKAPTQGVKRGAALANVDMFLVFVPTEAGNVPPSPPNGGDSLPRIGIRMPTRRHEAHVATSMGLPVA